MQRTRSSSSGPTMVGTSARSSIGTRALCGKRQRRVPLIISAPGHRPGVCDRPVSLLDIYPTLNELCALPPYDGLANSSKKGRAGKSVVQTLDGVSLAPLLRDPKAEWRKPAVIEFKRGNAAVRSERYRYIRYRDGGEELYDHRTDPHEWFNLAASKAHQAIKRELAGWIAKEWAESAPTKSAFRFDPHSFTWTHKKTGEVTLGREEVRLEQER